VKLIGEQNVADISVFGARLVEPLSLRPSFGGHHQGWVSTAVGSDGHAR
jgi:hypothetical protein